MFGVYDIELFLYHKPKGKFLLIYYINLGQKHILMLAWEQLEFHRIERISANYLQIFDLLSFACFYYIHIFLLQGFVIALNSIRINKITYKIQIYIKLKQLILDFIELNCIQQKAKKIKILSFTSFKSTKNMKSSFKMNSMYLNRQKQSVNKSSKNSNHNRINSMIQISNSKYDFISSVNKEKQKQKQCPLPQNSNILQRQIIIDAIIMKQFSQLKAKIKIQCQSVNNNDKKLIQNPFLAKSVSKNNLKSESQSNQIQFKITETELLKLMVDAINNHLKQSSKYQTEYLLLNHHSNQGQKKEQYNFQNFIGNNEQKYQGDTKEIEETRQLNLNQKIQNIQVLDAYSRKRKLSKEQNTKKNSFDQTNLLNNVASKNMQNPVNIPPKFQFFNNFNMSCAATVSQILYKEAISKDFASFNDFFEKIMLESKPIISQMHFFKKQKIELTNLYLYQINKKLALLNAQLAFVTTENVSALRKENSSPCQLNSIGEQIDEICVILKKINQIHNLDSIFFECNRPCCKYQRKNLTSLTSSNKLNTKAKILINLKQSAKKSFHYKNDSTDQYFTRYYKKNNFDQSKIYSISKTKTEEMEMLQKSYYKNRENSKLCRRRCQSLCSGFEAR